MAPTIIFLIGAPGSGKGTLGRKLCSDHDMYHFSVGDYMREICRSTDSSSDEMNIVRDHLKQQKLLPSEIIMPLLKQKIEKEERNAGGGGGSRRAVLVDGFPRDIAQAIGFEEQVGVPALAICLNCPKDEAKRRYLSRKVPDRMEDTEELFERRYCEYDVKNVGILERYRDANVLVEVAYAQSQSPRRILCDCKPRLNLEDFPHRFRNSNMRAPTMGRLRRSIVEVERKFQCNDTSTKCFRENRGSPPFRRLDRLGDRSFEDIYFDRDKILSTHGVWVRKRNGHWQAKIRPDAKRGTFANSQFEELTAPSDIARMLRKFMNVGIVPSVHKNFGLAQIARFTTYREMWKVDEKYDVVFDRTDFGHVVGEVELEREIQVDDHSEESLAQRQAAIAEMDAEIEAFMREYSWAFPADKPVGKLSAYFERQQQ
ncbi:hypothetical protein PRK78_007161 [Emydomyces testavorans]|uniref:Thiamine-triphosphatase n=1 Tax=Emydomyces testavorans TaxID=2070801 RepID=A0AAF0DNT1_9EURO|nr:hypothetical protein PRK78_007161 [Emydomyces testavorans]